ncbi:hypothetical protein [Thalassoglobus polymorphus]|uniref:Uncharacterized protein n=1 Tax=Thalassoglobus polymorphus TaxID=2527994 RepID=A0A517QHR7_9PLAN|nr:hypothetical protein [Thalassoglobus polymorphus]QDT31165.1 hypothetical protein Mal48_03970 [Thalassoglobus polymorphus]
MRKLLLLIVLTTTLTVSSGCVVPIWSATPDERVRQLIYQSENYRHVPNIWDRIWGFDMPDLATPFRTHGGVI